MHASCSIQLLKEAQFILFFTDKSPAGNVFSPANPSSSTPTTPVTSKHFNTKKRPVTQGRARAVTKAPLTAVRSSTSAAVLGEQKDQEEEEEPTPISTHCCPLVTRARLQNAGTSKIHIQLDPRKRMK